MGATEERWNDGDGAGDGEGCEGTAEDRAHKGGGGVRAV